MPIDYITALNQLRNLPGTAFQPSKVTTGYGAGEDLDPSAALLALQNQRKTELERNIPLGGMSPAAPADLSDVQSDIAKNPLTQQRAGIDQYLAAKQKANLQGFAEPAEQAAFGQQLEKQKISSPLDVEKLKGMLGLQTEQERIRGVIESARLREQGYADRTAAQRAKVLADNTARIQVAAMHNPALSGSVARLVTEIGRVKEGIDRGKLKADDPNVISHLDELERQMKQFSGPQTGAPTTPQPGVGGGVDPEVQQLLGDPNVKAGTHKLSDGSTWFKGADGKISKVQ
jgi:hypothetical protein